MEPSTSIQVRLFAVTPKGAVELDAPNGATGIHDVLDDQPLGIYEAFRTFQGRFHRLDRHFDRADASLAMLDFDMRVDRNAICLALDGIAALFDHDTRIRMDVLARPSPQLGTDQRTLLSVERHVPVAQEILENGVSVGIEDELSRDRPRIKHASWVLERRASTKKTPGDFEMLLVNESGHVLECTSANFFGVVDDHLIAPADDVLMGITRGSVLDVAREIGIAVEERILHRDELDKLDEALLTSSSRGIVPIVTIDGIRVGAGTPGPVCRRLSIGYEGLLARSVRPAREFVA